jgi:hypothetical protein
VRHVVVDFDPPNSGDDAAFSVEEARKLRQPFNVGRLVPDDQSRVSVLDDLFQLLPERDRCVMVEVKLRHLLFLAVLGKVPLVAGQDYYSRVLQLQLQADLARSMSRRADGLDEAAAE